MACYRPITAWKPSDGPIHFSEKKDCREIQISCGQCIGCRIAKREAWAIRCLAESKVHSENCFITLTYDEDHYPQYGSLHYPDFQLFMKRLRKSAKKKVRFFMCGEYGEEMSRPHFHALLFGYNFADRVKCNSLWSSTDIYRSPLLEKLWPFGFSSIGEVTYASARYCAAYTVKKINGDLADSHYMRVDSATGEIVHLEPEFAQMSLKPGIGFEYLRKYWHDLYDVHDGFVVDGKLKKIPRYFDSKMDELAPLLMDDIEFQRFLKRDPNDNTRSRLETREKVIIARERFNKERSGNNGSL